MPLDLTQVAFREKFRVGKNRSQRMAQIVGNRARHSADGCQSLRVQKLALRFLQSKPHAMEGGSQCGDLIAAVHLEWIGEVAFLQCVNACHELGERARESGGHEKHEGAAGEYRRETHQHNPTIQTLEKRGGLVEGFEHGQRYGDRSLRRQPNGCCEKPLGSELNLPGFGIRCNKLVDVLLDAGSFRRGYRTDNHGVLIPESHLAGGHPAHVSGHCIVYFVADGQNSDGRIVFG